MHVRWLLASLGVMACTFELAPLEEQARDAGSATGATAGQGATGQDAGSSGSAGVGLTAGSSGGGASGAGAFAGTSGSGAGGSGASATGGVGAGASGGVGGGGVCNFGQKQVLGSCAKCGTRVQTCDVNGQWGAITCENQGVCEPGAIGAPCTDPCEEVRCTLFCTWSLCQLEAGAKCSWQNGANYQCCGADSWQFCSKVSCDWFPCVSCGSDSGCKAAC